jgi:hypothetical protein
MRKPPAALHVEFNLLCSRLSKKIPISSIKSSLEFRLKAIKVQPPEGRTPN